MTIETIEHRNHTIKIVQDELPSNPLSDWDFDELVMVAHDNSLAYYGSDELETPRFTREVIKEHGMDIANLFTTENYISLRGFLRDYHNYTFNSYENDIAEMFNETIRELFEGESNYKQPEIMSNLWNYVDGYVAYTEMGTGYVQSAFHYIVVVAKIEEYSDADTALSCAKGLAQVYRDWSYNDVFGFVIEDEAGDELDSCYGFYGEYNSDEMKRVIADCISTVDDSIKQLELDFEVA